MRMPLFVAPLWRWGLLAAAAISLAALASFDRSLKTARHGGHALPSPIVSVEFSDLPEFWSALQVSPAGRAAEENLARPLHEVSLALYRQTGIRPTPQRTAAWLGRHARLSANASGWVLSLRPGILARGLHILRRLQGHAPVGDAFAFGNLWYQWEYGELLVGSDAASLASAADQAPVPGHALRRDEFHVELAGGLAGTVSAGTGYPISFSVPAGPPRPHIGAPARPPVTAAASLRLADSAQLSVAIRGARPLLSLLARRSAPIASFIGVLEEVPPPLVSARGPLALALLGVPVTGGVPVPRAAGVYTGREAYALPEDLHVWARDKGLAGIPQPGGGFDRTLYPYFAGEWALVCEQSETRILVASAAVAADEWPETAPDSGWTEEDVAELTVDWGRVAIELRGIARWMAEAGLWGTADEREAEAFYGPMLSFLSEQGELRIAVQRHGNTLDIGGFLAGQPGISRNSATSAVVETGAAAWLPPQLLAGTPAAVRLEVSAVPNPDEWTRESAGLDPRLAPGLRDSFAILSSLQDARSGHVVSFFRPELYGELDWTRFGAWPIRAWIRAGFHGRASQLLSAYIRACALADGELPAAFFANGRPGLPGFIRDAGAAAWCLAAAEYAARNAPGDSAWRQGQESALAAMLHHLTLWQLAEAGVAAPSFSPWAGHDTATLNQLVEMHLGMRAGLRLAERLGLRTAAAWSLRDREIASAVKLAVLNRPPPWPIDPLLMIWLRDLLPLEDPLWSGAIETAGGSIPARTVSPAAVLSHGEFRGSAIEAPVVRAALEALATMDAFYGQEPAGAALQ